MSSIEALISEFKFLNNEIPGAREIYELSRNAFLSGNNLLAAKLYRLNYFLHNSVIPFKAEIGKNCVFAYGGLGIVIHEGAKIGDRCNIGSNVTIGGGGTGCPTIGDDVYISTGVKILGGVNIGFGSILGANSVVTKSLPPFSVAFGAPAKISNTVCCENFDKYQGYYWCKGSPEGSARFISYYFKRHSKE